MMNVSFRGRLTAINASREEPARVWLRVLPQSARTDFYAEGVQPADVLLNATSEQVKGVNFGDEVQVEANMTHGVSARKDKNNPDKVWENYRTNFQITAIKKVS